MPYYEASKQDYAVWRSQLVWRNGIEQYERREFINEFAESIRIWMGKLGYKMEDRLNKELSFWLYRIYIQEIARKNHGAGVYIPEPLHRNTQEDYEHYNNIITIHDVDVFMCEWSNAEDMDDKSIIGKRVLYELQDFLYNVIDIESSKQGRLIAKLWEDSDSNSESEYEYAKTDVYIEEAKKGLHGGRGAKV
jgi:hypothetical protein